MKQILLILAFVMGYCLAASAENMKLVPSTDDSTRMDTILVSEMSDVDVDAEIDEANNQTDFLSHSFVNHMNDGAIVAIISVIVIFGLPLFILIAILWFRYKNKQARYRLAAEALASGKNIPKDLFNEPENQNHEVLTKGIKNIALGIGLGVFLWVLTEEEGLAAIGFLIFCMGVGQVAIAYATRSKKEITYKENNDSKDKEE